MNETWTNWVGNQTFKPLGFATVSTEEEVIEVARTAVLSRTCIRTHGTGHSFTPIVETSGTLLDMSALKGVISIDRENCLVTAWAQTPIHDFGDALWRHGLSLANQGDIDTQTVSGAIATGTHGSGLRLGSFSSTLEAARIVDGRGKILDVSRAETPDTLAALQTSIGMLGIMTRVTVKVVPAYILHEQIKVMHVDEVLENWDHLLTDYRHFSFFWMPTEKSSALYGFPSISSDYCMVKLYKEVDAGFSAVTGADRVDRSYRIYSHTFEPNFHELEYFIPIENGKDAFAAQRKYMLNSLPNSQFPLEVRFVAADDGWLSPNYKRTNLVMSVSGIPNTDYWPYLLATDALFASFNGRPHWGKLHFMTPGRMPELFPKYEDFKTLRREHDPNGLFLNPHLQNLFA
jgi:FAD/FMN-containing dehydrogenase